MDGSGSASELPEGEIVVTSTPTLHDAAAAAGRLLKSHGWYPSHRAGALTQQDDARRLPHLDTPPHLVYKVSPQSCNAGNNTCMFACIQGPPEHTWHVAECLVSGSRAFSYVDYHVTWCVAHAHWSRYRILYVGS